MSLTVRIRVPASPLAIECAVEGLTALNFAMMSHARETLGSDAYPALYDSGVRYKREPLGEENWQTAAELLTERSGDCEDLAAYRAAELRMQGEAARVVIRTTPRGSFHAVVQRGDGSIEDPSLILLGKQRQI